MKCGNGMVMLRDLVVKAIMAAAQRVEKKRRKK